jgi:small-conductance mechanosensitive channel
VQHELRHRILERLRKEGIEIPFPQRTVHLRRGSL